MKCGMENCLLQLGDSLFALTEGFLRLADLPPALLKLALLELQLGGQACVLGLKLQPVTEQTGRRKGKRGEEKSVS